MNGKITVFGAGNVGGAVTRRLIERKLCKSVVLMDRTQGKADGVALDILEASPIDLLEPICVSGEDLEQTRDSDIVIITAGATRKEGMTRDDLLRINAGIVGDCVARAAKFSPYAFYIIVSNPLNVMCHVAMRAGQIPRSRVTGMAGILDSCRFQYFISKELNVSVENVQAMVLGEHGEDMVPIPRYSTVAGVPLPELLSQDRLDALIGRTRDGGAEIIRLMRTSAFYAPASAVIQMVSAVVMNKKKNSALRRVSHRGVRHIGSLCRRSREAGRARGGRHHRDSADRCRAQEPCCERRQDQETTRLPRRSRVNSREPAAKVDSHQSLTHGGIFPIHLRNCKRSILSWA